LFGVSRSLGVEGASSSLHLREAELTTGLALEDLVEVFLAEEGLAIEDFEAAQVEGTSSKISTATDLPSRLTLGKASPELERLSGGRIAVSIQGVLLDCTLAGRPLGRNLTRVGLTILPPSFFLGGDTGAFLMGLKCLLSSASMLLLLSSLGHRSLLLIFPSSNNSSSKGKLRFFFGCGTSKQLLLFNLLENGSKS